MPARLFFSSGDLIADRRFEFARDLQLKGDLVAAADLLMQAIEPAPLFTSAWFTLGKIRDELGLRDEAIAAFRQARDADPEDRHGASLCLMQLGPGLVLIPAIIWAWFSWPASMAFAFTVVAIPITVVDNVLKPILMSRGLSTPMPVILIGVIGGTLSHGLLGLFLGPIVLSVFYELLRAWAWPSETLPGATAAPAMAENTGTD